MMTDRELLELAAKAAGIVIDKSPYGGGGHGNTGFDLAGNAQLQGRVPWNPLTDDGDALRLAVKLGMVCDFGAAIVDAPHTIQGEGSDLLDANRQAIVLAAAEIGKAMA